MKKDDLHQKGVWTGDTLLKKIWRMMKLTGLFMLISFVAISAGTYSQNTRFSFKIENGTLNDLFLYLEQNSEFRFAYNKSDLDDTQRISFKFENESVEQILNKVLDTDRLSISVKNEYIIITNKENVTGKPFNTTINQPVQTISGKVTDSSGSPLPGVTVVINGTTSGTITDAQGNYSLSNVSSDATLIFSFVGMKTQEMKATGKSSINVVMQEETIGLEEVVAIGYGTQNRREVTGSISKLDANQLEDIPGGQLSQKIQGKIAGVQINTSTGIPGKDLSIRIRGAASINAGNNPLYVIDGFPIVGDMSNINPNEIENISILKGSSASSMYGSRAANGVVLITTKKAKEGQNIVQFNAIFGVGQVPQRGRIKLMNAKEFLEDRKAWWEDKIKYEGYTGGVPALYQDPEAYTGTDTDWYDELLQSASQQSYNLSLLFDKGKFSSATTVGYYKEDGVIINSGYQRFSLRSNNDYEVNDHIRMGFNVAPTYQIHDNVEDTDGFYSTIYSAIITPPIFSPDDKNPDGSPMLSFAGPGLFGFPNWKITLQDQTNVSKKIQLISNAYVEVDFLKDFQYKSSFSVSLENQNDRVFSPSTVGSIFSNPPNLATGSYGGSFTKSWITENTLNFKKTIATNHNFNVMAGYSAQEYRYENGSFSGNKYPDDLIGWLSAAANVTGWENGATEWSLISMYGRLNYNYKGRYLLSASFRRDGSSRFGSDDQWGSFPSLSAGWIISDEEFTKKWPTLSYLKLRAEYGVVGNFNIGNYTQFGNISSTNYVFGNSLVSGRSQNSIGNNKLTWETTAGIDIGIDVAFLNDRVGLTIDYYNKNTKDMLYQIDIPMGTGYSNIQDNIGKFHFWGYEFALNTKNLVGGFKWNTDFNISFNRNKVIKLGTNDEPIGSTDSYPANCNRTEVGHPIGMFYGFVSDGIYMTQQEFDTQPKYTTSMVGTCRYKDVNGDGVITIDDRTFIGNPNPKFIFGITNTFSYKNFDMNIIISGAYGGDKMRAILEWTETLEGIFNVEKYMKDRWRSPENPGAGIIGRTYSGTTEFARNAQSRFVDDASYLTVKNITFGYTLPKKIKYVGKSRVFISIQQALVLTKYHGVNPEASLHGLNALQEGIDVSPYPVPRTFALGVNFNF